MAFDASGNHDFDALRNRTQDDRVQLCAFDLLELNGKDFREKALRERKAWMENLHRPDGLQIVEHIEGDGAQIFDHACKLGFEGIVSKRTDLGYEPGPSKRWIKVKNPAHPAIQRIKDAFEREREKAVLRVRA